MFYTFMWFIALLLLLLVDVVYVTSFIGDYYPEFEFFYWVVELVLLISHKEKDVHMGETVFHRFY